ncbi:hypothetical protein T492DRAFT_1033040 [Pavlovales sp. CCMP2436]|nr:hypothetical protein T492DRAFT_1033040 [Pavlovales sp. CCMP2436]
MLHQHNMPITIGVCTMAKKARSAPMEQLLSRLRTFAVDGRREFHVLVFEQEAILNDPVESWPKCDALIAFFSKGFPLDKLQVLALTNNII